MNKTDKLYFVDTSLTCQGFTESQKVEIAKKLNQLNMDTVEIPLNIEHSVLQTLNGTEIAIKAQMDQKQIAQAVEILKNIENKRLRLYLSEEFQQSLDFENKYIRDDLVKYIYDAVTYAKNTINKIELVIEKTEKLHKIYLYRLIESAISAEASIVTLSDFNCTRLPGEYAEFFKGILLNLPEQDNFICGSACKNVFGCATAITLEAICAGVQQVDVRIFKPKPDFDYPCFYLILAAIKMRKDLFTTSFQVNIAESQSSLDLMSTILTE